MVEQTREERLDQSVPCECRAPTSRDARRAVADSGETARDGCRSVTPTSKTTPSTAR